MKGNDLRERNENKWISFHYRLAHHPTCESFSEHFYRLFRKKVCRGCVMMYSGLITSIIFLPLANLFIWGSDAMFNFYLVYIFFIPTIYSAKYKPHRMLRDVFRFFLGFTYTQAVISIYFSFSQGFWWAGILVILTYLSGSTILSREREKSNNRVCQECPELNNPHCSGLRDYTQRKNILKGAAYRFDTFSE